MNEPRPFVRSPAALAALGALLVLLSSEAISRALSGTPADFTLFLGRFHPLAVHLPIGVLLLVVAAEALAFFPKFRARVDPALGLALPALLVATLGAFLLGQMLARSGDFVPRVLNLHRRLEFFATAGVCACFAAWAFHVRAGNERTRLVYRVLLGTTVTVMSVGAHFGGTMTRGENYLARYAPGPLKPLLGGAAKDAQDAAPPKPAHTEPTLFENAVLPILKERCSGCHGAEKVKGSLRLDSLAGIMKGGENGVAVTPGVLEKSPLLEYVLLPLDDDEHMPPKGKPQPTAGEIAVLRFWIERGAGDKLLLRDALPPSEARAVLEKAVSLAPAQPAPESSSGTPVPPAPPAGSNTPIAAAPAPLTPAPQTPAPQTPAPTAPPKPALAEEPTVATVPAGRSARAILGAACASCHGASKQKGKLRVDTLDALLAGGKHGPAIVPGKPGQSELVRRLRLPLADDEHMPPEKESQLSESDIQTLAAWVASLELGSRVASATDARSAGGRSNSGVAAGESPAPSRPAAAPNDTAPTPEQPGPASKQAVQTEPTPEELAGLPARIVLFPDAVGPLLADRCGNCHAGDKPAMGLRVDSHAALLRGGLSGPAVVAGKPDESLLVKRVTLPLEDGDHMPPDDEPQLTSGEVALLRTWVEHGAALAFEIDKQALSPAMQRAILGRPPKTWTARAPAPPAEQSGGCAACAVGGRDDVATQGWGAAGGLLLSLILRRKSRQKLPARRPPVPI